MRQYGEIRAGAMRGWWRAAGGLSPSRLVESPAGGLMWLIGGIAPIKVLLLQKLTQVSILGAAQTEA